MHASSLVQDSGGFGSQGTSAQGRALSPRCRAARRSPRCQRPCWEGRDEGRPHPGRSELGACGSGSGARISCSYKSTFSAVGSPFRHEPCSERSQRGRSPDSLAALLTGSGDAGSNSTSARAPRCHTPCCERSQRGRSPDSLAALLSGSGDAGSNSASASAPLCSAIEAAANRSGWPSAVECARGDGARRSVKPGGAV